MSPATRLFEQALDLHRAGDLPAAAAAYLRVIRVAPDLPEPHSNLAAVLLALGQVDAALLACRQALTLRPRFADAEINLGNILISQGNFADSADAYARALVLTPERCEALGNLGEALRLQGRIDEAVEVCLEAQRRGPQHAEIANHLGNAMMSAGRLPEAAEAYGRALELRPHFPQAAVNRAAAFLDMGEAEAGLAACRATVAMAPDNADAQNNLGVALMQFDHVAEAVEAYRRALAANPDHVKAHHNLAVALLKRGLWREGWAEFEWRRKIATLKPFHDRFTAPQWEGEPLDGTLVVWCEQGYGDSLQFARYLPQAAARVGRLVVLSPQPLVRLLAAVPGVADVVLEQESPPPHERHLPMIALARVLGIDRPEAVTPPGAYLPAAADAVEVWRQRLAGLPGLKVGLAWSGDPRKHDRAANSIDRRRSMTPEALAPLATIPGLCLINLQKGSGAVEALPPGLVLQDWMAEMTDFADTAALVANLDLVISVDTATVHLAGGLGRPVWILSRFDGCWRWLEGRDDTPWYPSARLFRQTAPGDWDEVMERVAEAVRGIRPAAITGHHAADAE